MTNQQMPRRQFLSLSAAGILATGAGRVLGAQAKQPSVVWHDVREWGVEGRGFDDTEKYFDRLPARAKKTIRGAVWNLSRHSAGMLVRFRTDAFAIWSDHVVTSSGLALPHMPATGVSGLDLYGEDAQGNVRWIAVSRPTKREMITQLVSGLLPGERNYTIYLPLYNGTESLKVGVPLGATFEPIAPRQDKPLVFYGTSITHGACASRPGMPHPAIIGRRLNRPVINLGFSGNGKMEEAVGEFLTELDPAVYVIDCLPNMVGPEVAARTEPLVHQLRKARPNTPIVLVEDRTYANTPFLPSRQTRHDAARGALKTAYANLQKAGVKGLSYLEGEKLLGDDRDDTTDGSHPSDLGFHRHAEAFEPVLRAALAKA